MGIPLKRSEKVKYLGVTFDQKMQWEKHINDINRKILIKYSKIRTIASCLTPHTKNLLINALVMPYFNYCSSAWACATQGRLGKLEKRLKCVRTFLGKEREYSMNNLLIKNDAILVFKAMNHIAPDYMRSKFLLTKNCHNHQTRGASKNRFTLPLVNTEFGKKAFPFRAAKVWINCYGSEATTRKQTTTMTDNVRSIFLLFHVITTLEFGERGGMSGLVSGGPKPDACVSILTLSKTYLVETSAYLVETLTQQLAWKLPISERLTWKSPTPQQLAWKLPTSERLTWKSPTPQQLAWKLPTSPRLTWKSPTPQQLAWKLPTSPRLTWKSPTSPRLTWKSPTPQQLAWKLPTTCYGVSRGNAPHLLGKQTHLHPIWLTKEARHPHQRGSTVLLPLDKKLGNRK
ncbi:uncharacterized protein LOC130628531 [Hydractinia symbiolongicarpus]|uniref:uncharacterized protein LOC130628531 n=1 Tax=Hydractinia symbiolongicarpus TaxID=13093 RepID=UPI002551AB19|nr:uncharacterized protein LOC130628531 [Hydractinia symbiolongicarpus]